MATKKKAAKKAAPKKAAGGNIRIQFATMNGTPTQKTVRAGTLLSDFAEELSTETGRTVAVKDLFVNGRKEPAGYQLRADDFVAQTTNIAGGL